MNDIAIFEHHEFGRVRTLIEDGEVLFGATDVAKALGYSNPHDAVNRHCRGVVKREGVSVTTNQHGVSTEQKVEMSFIPESDLYLLIFRSKLPNAEKFTDWVVEEVLPALRKTGTYTVQQVPRKPSYEARVQAAQLLDKIAGDYEGTTYKQILQAYATRELLGEFALPLPQLPTKTYSATEVGDILGISANRVGRVANKFGMKTPEFGEWFKDKSHYGAKEVSTFRYYESAIPEIRKKSEILDLIQDD